MTDPTLPTMTSRAQEILEEQNQPTPPAENPAKASAKKRWEQLRREVDLCKTYRNKMGRNWSLNIDYRRGKPFSSQIDDDAIAVNLDWSHTKTKHSSLFSQVPQARMVHSPELTALPWVSKFEREVNDVLKPAGIEGAMEEVMPDCINAAGFGAVIVYYDSITEDKEVPAIDLSMLPPELQAQAMQTGMLNGQPIPMETVPQVIDKRYVIQRISPADFLWPLKFMGSDFNRAPWLGRTGRLSWAEAVRKWKLKESDKATLAGGEETSSVDRLTHDWDRDKSLSDADEVGFDEIFYKEFQFHEDAQNYQRIRHVVFLHGKTEPVVDGPWEGQDVDDESGQLIGSMKSPIQVLTLTYITDEPIPPSDSAIGRPQVNEVNKGRTLQIRQRARSLPIRWYDVNRTDPAIQHSLMRGTWQHMIPVQGDGSRVLGEIQRSPMPQENFTFDGVAKTDLEQAWSIGPNQLGTGAGVETKGESSVLQTNFSTKISKERARVASFFVNICEVLGGLMCLYEDPAKFGEGFTPLFSRSLQFSILADSTVLVDSNQRLERLDTFLNKYLKTGWVNPEPVIKEIATLIGLDASTVVVPPKPQQPDLPNISLRLSGGDDLVNPLVLAFLVKTGQAPTPELIEQAKKLIQQSVVEPQQPQAPNQAPPPGAPMPEPPPPGMGEAYPQAGGLPEIVQRKNNPNEEM